MKHLKQVERPFHIMRTMPSGECLFSAETTLAGAKERTDRLPAKQLPARVVVRRNGAWESVYDRPGKPTHQQPNGSA